MLHFLDFEVYKKYWCVTIINPITKNESFIENSKEALEQYYQKFKQEIFVGYNITNYDKYIFQGILCDFDPFEISQFIIAKKKKGFEFSPLLNKVKMIIYDVMAVKTMHSLKTYEAFMGNDICETDIPFDYSGDFTEEMKNSVRKYNKHDVEQTIEVFYRNYNEFQSKLTLIKTFDLPLKCIGKTQAQLAAIILGAKRKDYDDDWNIRLPDTLRLKKYSFVADWFINPNNHDEEKKLKCDIAGVPHIFAWGGLHGAIKKYHYTCSPDELLIMADVDQLYPTIMIKYGLLSRSVKDAQKFEHILHESLRLKAEKKKKEREPYKRICNITYGAEGDRYNNMYDPLHRKLVCIYGQLLLLDLIEILEPHFKLIQTNTDGVLFLIKRKDFDKFDNLVYSWEKRTGLHMSFDYFKKIYQKDVNNYIAVEFCENKKMKGGYVKESNGLDNDLPIVNKALVDYMVKGVPVWITIKNCDELIQFQKIVKLSSKYKCAWFDGSDRTEKTFRVFASRRVDDGIIGKRKTTGATIEKYANTPDKCFIENGDINNKKIPPYLNKSWYVDMAKKRLLHYGIEI